jgi:hypothetical protein
MPPAAVKLLTWLDENVNSSRQLIWRTAGGDLLPDTEDMVLERGPASELAQQRPQIATRTGETRP